MSTSYSDIDDFVSAQETATTEAGKYFCVNVPDYEDTVTSESSDKQSYLRIGAAISDWTTEPGADLLAMAYATGACGRVSQADGGYSIAEGSNATAVLDAKGIDSSSVGDIFIDDQRERGTGNERPDGAPGHGLSAEERRAQSAKLHSGVGWRDHTDGNRISTTRGDKVEVVYGNYKMVVLGRQSDPACAQGWEALGDHIQDYADGTMPGASVTVEWVPDTTYAGSSEKGAWLLQNSTERVYQYSRNAGNFRTQNWGDLIENYTGSENPKSLGEAEDDGMTGHPKYRDEGLGKSDALAPSVSSEGLPRGNPTIIERTWATKIDTMTGSEAWKIPSISDETWAESITEKTRAKSISSQTGAASDAVDHIVERTYSLAVESYNYGLFAFDFSLVGLEIAMHGGATLEMTVGAKAELSYTATFEAVYGWKVEYATAVDKTAGFRNNVDAIKTQISGSASSFATSAQEFYNNHLTLAQISASMGQMRTALHNQWVQMTTLDIDVSDMHFIL